MRRFLTALISLAGLVALTAASHAQTNSTPEQAKAFVEKAVAFYKSAGKEKALAVFSDPKGEFVQGDLYIFALDAVDGKMTNLAHINKALIGKSQIELKDAEGKAFVQEMADKLKSADSAWVDYKWPNPETKKIATKRSYVVKSGDVVLGAGVYN